jgi:preprotein translocase subunit SecA
MENLRQGVGLHAYGQRDPLVMYRSEGHEKFQEMLGVIQHDIVHTIFHATMMEEEATRSRAPRRAATRASGVKLTPVSGAVLNRQPVPAGGVGIAKVGRNEACPCGSGKKYKRCHGVAA